MASLSLGNRNAKRDDAVTDLNEAIEHIRTVCEDNANSPNPVMVIKFIQSIVDNALRVAGSPSVPSQDRGCL